MVVQDSALEGCFDEDVLTVQEEAVLVQENVEQKAALTNIEDLNLTRQLAEDISVMRPAGTIVDDEVKENIPAPTEVNAQANVEPSIFEEEWGYNGVCYRRQAW